jgi:hypothetical protein
MTPHSPHDVQSRCSSFPMCIAIPVKWDEWLYPEGKIGALPPWSGLGS